MNGQVTTANPTAKSPIARIDAIQKPFGAAGAQHGVDPYSEREVAVCIIGPDASDEIMRVRCVEGLRLADPDSTFRTPLLPGSAPPTGGLASGRVVEEGTPTSPARSQTARLGRLSSKPFRWDSEASLSAMIQSANLEGQP